MDNLATGDLVIEVDQRDPGVIALNWKGKSNERYPRRTIGPFFDSVFKAAEENKATIEMRFEALEYLNSATISALVGLIRDLREKKIKLVISFDASQKWQKLCFDALRVFEKPDGLLVMRHT